MKKVIINTKDAPAAIGPYSQAVKCGSMLFISGQLPMNPRTGEMLAGEPGELTKRAMDNLGAILKAAELSYKNLVKVTIFTTRLEKFQEINEAYKTYFPEEPPARAVVGVQSLPKGAVLEIEAIAMF